MIDREELLGWLSSRRDTVHPPIAKAIYEGLRMRLERGDFDEGKEQQDG